jgi:cytochrome P450
VGWSARGGPVRHAAASRSPAGRRVTVQGWVHRRRRLSAVSFLIVRDRGGLAQVVVRGEDESEGSITRQRGDLVNIRTTRSEAEQVTAARRAFPLGEGVTLAELEGDPHRLIASLRAREPVSWLPTLGGWFVTRHDLVAQVMRDAATFTVDDPRFSTARVVGPSMLSLDGAEHARHREPFAYAFRPTEVRARFTRFVADEADRLIDAIAPMGRAELCRSVAGPLAVAVITEALGIAGSAAASLLSWYEAIVGAVSGIAAGEEVSSAGLEAVVQLRGSVEASVADRRGVSLLAAAAERAGQPGGAGRLRLAEVVSNAAVLMFGGIETTEGMITNAILHLLGHPDQLALVLADSTLVTNAIEESLRLEPAAAVVDRYATRDTKLGGAPVRCGDLVMASIAGANRDPKVFVDPDRFDVPRENAGQHLAFAHGPHFCLGVHLARVEAQIAVNRLLDRLPGLRLDLERPSAPRGLVFRKPPALHVLWSADAAAPRS